MSKKKGKPAPKKAPKKKVAKKSAAKKSVAASRATPQLAAKAAPSRRTKSATIFLFQNGSGTKIRTSPQRIYANPGDHVEFNVVNMIDDSDVPVTIEFAVGDPFEIGAFQFRGWQRKAITNGTHGTFEYTVKALGVEEDPEIELPEGN